MPATTDSGSGNSCNREQEQSLSLPFSLREVDVDGKPTPVRDQIAGRGGGKQCLAGY